MKRFSCRRAWGRCLPLPAAFSVALTAAVPAAAQPAGAVASAPVDPRIFREGQIRRLSGTFGAWTAVCDEIAGLNRRYCSLYADLRGPGGGARMTVSTGDDGRPAALLRAPHGLILSRPIHLRYARQGAVGAGARFDRPLRPFACDRQGCVIVWTLGAVELERLRRGDALSLHYFRWRQPPYASAELASPRHHIAQQLTVPGRGFAEAVAAALK